VSNKLELGMIPMGPKQVVYRFFRLFKLLRIKAYFRSHENTYRFEFNKDKSVEKDIIDKYNYHGKLLALFTQNKKQVINKWHHYIPIYDRHLREFQNKEINFLEIGVSEGGSMLLWKNFLGEEALIYGIDINPACSKLNDIVGQVRIGSQSDIQFLDTIIREMNGIDIVLDDGSHHMRDVRTSFEYLFPKLRDGGIYIIEDLHTSFWKYYGGGFRSKDNFFRLVFEYIFDMHHWYHNKPQNHELISNSIRGIHIYDSMVIFEKGIPHKPCNSRIGSN
jgi:hypothetical protein